MYECYTLKIDINALDRAKAIVSESERLFIEADSEKEKIITGTATVPEGTGYNSVVTAKDEALAKIKVKLEFGIQELKKKILEQKNKFISYVDEQTAPTTEKLAEVRAELDLLSLGLFKTAEELNKFIAGAGNNIDNIILREAIKKYAREHELNSNPPSVIPEYEFSNKAEALREFAEKYFSYSETACELPDSRSYYGLFMKDERAFFDMINSYGISAEYELSK